VFAKQFKANMVLYGSTTISDTLDNPFTDDSPEADPGKTLKLERILFG